MTKWYNLKCLIYKLTRPSKNSSRLSFFQQVVADYVAGNISALYGTRYSTGSSSTTICKKILLFLLNSVFYYDVYIFLDPTDGTSQDWAKGSGIFKYVYTAELRDTGAYGFLLPATLIRPTAEETWQGFKVVCRHIAAN